MNLLLFDIDGTLMLSGGAGYRGMTRAFADLFDEENAFAGVEIAGRTDTSILDDAMQTFAIEPSDANFQRFRKRYFQLLPEEIEKPDGDKRVMPGIRPLLQHLSKMPQVHLGLLTGNWEISGRIKLAHFGLADYFSFGAFADDSSVRSELLPFAVERFQQQTGLKALPDQVFVIGDTPADIHCAKPHGAVSVAVAAAGYSVDQLQEHAPDYLFESLEDISRVLDILH